MTDNIYEWFGGLATLTGFGYFMAGFGFAFTARWMYSKAKHESLNIPWYYIGIVIGCCAIIVTTLQSSSAYNTAKTTAHEVQDCQREFNQALRDRSKITSENDELSQVQRRIVFDWIHDLIFPPEPYASMTTDDQRRQDYGLALTINTEHTFKASLARQEELQRQRERKPLPDPLCGHDP